MDLARAMRVFVEVVDTGRFSRAAEKLGTSKAEVSRQVSAMEERLGTRLVQRTTRRLALTELGREFYDRAQRILADIDEMETVVGQHSISPCGHLRISAPVSFGIRKLGPMLPEFCRRYPRISLEVDFSDRISDLVNDGVDVALRLAHRPAEALIARRIAPVRMLACAAPSYLAKYGELLQPADLASRAVLVHTNLWNAGMVGFVSADGATTSVRIAPRLLSNNGDLLAAMAREGVGVLIQPDFLAEQDFASGALVEVLPGWTCGEFGLYILYPSREHLPNKVRVFVDFVVKNLEKSAEPQGGGSATEERQRLL